jgi:hypothetical protein
MLVRTLGSEKELESRVLISPCSCIRRSRVLRGAVVDASAAVGAVIPAPAKAPRTESRMSASMRPTGSSPMKVTHAGALPVARAQLAIEGMIR